MNATCCCCYAFHLALLAYVAIVMSHCVVNDYRDISDIHPCTAALHHPGTSMLPASNQHLHGESNGSIDVGTVNDVIGIIHRAVYAACKVQMQYSQKSGGSP